MVQEQPLTQQPKTQSGLFYGYIIGIAAFCILFISYGLRYTYGVFFTPMVDDMGWNAATASLAYSISMVFEGLFSLVMGGLNDKYGPRIVVTCSGVVLGAGYCLMTLVNSVWQLYLFYGLIVGIGVGGIFVPIVSTVSRWFTARRGLMIGLAGTGVSIGVLTLAPISTKLIELFTWRGAYLGIGILSLVLVLTMAQFLKRDPAVMGLVPYGQKKLGKGDTAASPVAGYSFREALHTHQYWILLIMLFCFGFNALTINVFLVPDAIKSGISAAIAATILSVLGVFQIGGRIGLGFMADKMGSKRMFLLGYIVTAAALPLLIYFNTLWAFYAFALFYGFVHGGFYSAQSPLVASVFGLKYHGTIFGSCGIGLTVGGALGPFLTGVIVDHTGSYQIAFISCEVISMAGIIMTLVLRPIKGQVFNQNRL